MKTNVIMKSEQDRELFGVIIRQETKTSMMSLTDLQEAYTRARVLNGWSVKHLTEVFRDKTNIERMFYVLKEQEIINSEICDFMKEVEEKGTIKVFKNLGVYKTTGRGENKQVMCNPYIWILVAMELNPQLYAKVVVWLTDHLIVNRIDACDLNIDLMKSVSKNIPEPNYSRINKALNEKIFGHHETGMRNLASEKELKKLNELETNMRYCIDHKLVKNNDELCKAIKEA